MSAEHRIRRLSFALVFGMLGNGAVIAEDLPDLEFLEYLGSWEESDEDWLLFNQFDADEAKADEERSDPAPTGEESTENDDEL